MLKILLLLVAPAMAAKPNSGRVTPVKPALESKAESKLLEIDGKIFPIESFPATCNALFKGAKCAEQSYGHFHTEAVQEGDLVHTTSTFSDPDGPQVIENSWSKNGHVEKAVIVNHVTGKTCEVEIKGGKAIYKTTEKDGKVKTSEDEAEENLVVPSTMMTYIQPHFRELAEGKELHLRVAVLDRREAFSFVVKKDHDDQSELGKSIMVLKMAPSSIFVKALVDPMYFYVYPDVAQMFAFQGKSSLRKKEGSKYKEMIVKVAYDYKVNRLEDAKNAPEPAKSSCDPLKNLGNTPAKCEVKAE